MERSGSAMEMERMITGHESITTSPLGRPIRVLVVDDDDQILRMIPRVLSRFPDLEVAGAAKRASDAAEAAAAYEADVVLMDFNMPDATGAQATRLVLRAAPNVKVIALSGTDDDEAVAAMITAGASGYLLKTSIASEIHRSIVDVVKGHAALSPEVTSIVLRDLVALVERERTRADALAEIAEMKTSFIDNVSHEFRTPLTVIRGATQTLRRRGPLLDEETRESLLQSVENASKRLDRMIHFIFTVSGMTDSPGPDADCQLTEALKAALEDIPAARRSRVVEAVEPRRLRIAMDHLQEVIHAAIDNALKFSEGEVTVVASTRGALTTIEIRDTGPGMNDELIERVLDQPFVQADAGSTRAYDGLGLSLYVARKLMQNAGGDLEIVSVEGAGTTVRILVHTAGLWPAA